MGEQMPKCRRCGDEFPNRIIIDDVPHIINSRKFCLKCSPFGKHNTKAVLDNRVVAYIFNGVKMFLAGTCTYCGKEIYNKTGKIKFCSIKCKTRHYHDEYIKRWLNGEERGGTDFKVSNYVKRHIIETRGEKCERCGYNKITPSTGKVWLEVLHMDGDYSNHVIDNLLLVCSNCFKEIRPKPGVKFKTPSEYNKSFVVRKYDKMLHGYWFFIDKEHPLSDKRGVVLLHRHVASVKDGRWLTKNNIVHHVDGNKDNNDPSNLEIMDISEHASLHLRSRTRTNKGRVA